MCIHVRCVTDKTAGGVVVPLRRVVPRLYFDLSFAPAGSPQAYVLAFALSGFAVFLRMSIDPWLNGVQFITLFPAVAASALFFGVGAGLSSVFWCALGVLYFVLPPSGSFKVLAAEDVLALSLFIIVGLLIAGLVGAMRFALARYLELSAKLEDKVAQRTAELEQAQNQLIQAQKMEAIGQLTGGIAHDFNNMLAVVTGNLDLMRRALAAGRADIQRNLDNAIEGADRAADLTRRLLAFARRQPLAPEIVDVNRVVQRMNELLRSTLGGGITIETVLAGGLWPTYVDVSQLENSILNLAVNARDAMAGSGRLTLETANTRLDDAYAAKEAEVTPGQYVMVAVTDTGCGMPREIVAQAFDPFFTTKEPGHGTGLGLSQTFGFIKQSHGHIRIYSEIGRGTTVKMYLPRHRDASTAEQTREAPVPNYVPDGKPSDVVLVVEDDDQVRAMCVEALRSLGYSVIEASSGHAALDIMRAGTPLALLMADVIMPEMNGRELVEEARKMRPALKVLYTTGYTENAIVHNGELDAGVALLQKPYTTEQLGRMVRRCIDGQ
jgi:signal transduction histidine kinase/CheY-like chemotaxis protein